MKEWYLDETFDEENLYGIDKQIKWFLGTKEDFIECVNVNQERFITF